MLRAYLKIYDVLFNRRHRIFRFCFWKGPAL